MMRKQICFVLLIALIGCDSERNNRLSLEVSRRQQVVDEYTQVSISGGTFIKVEQAISATASTSVLRFVTRAESTQPTIRAQTTDCTPRVVHFSLDNLDIERTQCRFSAVRQSNKAVDRIGRDLIEPFGSIEQIGSADNGTFLVRPSDCLVEVDENQSMLLSLCLDWLTGQADVRPGHVTFEECFDATNRVACLEQTLGAEPAIASGPLEAEINFEGRTDEELVVAAIANLEADEDFIARLGQDLKLHNVDFVVVVGDLTSNGSVSEAERVKAYLDQHVEIPWFATLGDRDVDGNLGVEYLGLFGSASIAFDVNGVRLILLDSANGGLKETDELLDLWISDQALDGTGFEPLQHLVFTHYPPFADGGGSDPQFGHTLQAGALISRLTRHRALGLVVGQQRTAGREPVGTVALFHVGGSARTANGSWAKFVMDAACISACNQSFAPCTCLQYEEKLLP